MSANEEILLVAADFSLEVVILHVFNLSLDFHDNIDV